MFTEGKQTQREGQASCCEFLSSKSSQRRKREGIAVAARCFSVSLDPITKTMIDSERCLDLVEKKRREAGGERREETVECRCEREMRDEMLRI